MTSTQALRFAFPLITFASLLGCGDGESDPQSSRAPTGGYRGSGLLACSHCGPFELEPYDALPCFE
jgi:hypothetical protein